MVFTILEKLFGITCGALGSCLSFWATVTDLSLHHTAFVAGAMCMAIGICLCQPGSLIEEKE